MSVAIDHMYQASVTIELQNAADAASHAGARMLDGGDQGLVEAKQTAAALFAANLAHGEALDTTNTVIELGALDDAGVFQVQTDASEIMAVRVTVNNESYASLMASTVGINALVSSASSTAQSGGPSAADCPLPLAFPTCLIEALGGLDGNYCGADLVINYNPAPTDNVGWALINDTTVGANEVRDQLGTCSHTAYSDTDDDLLSLNNGQIQNALNLVAAMLSDSSHPDMTKWDSDWGLAPKQSLGSDIPVSTYGTQALVGPVALFDEDDYCKGGGSFNAKNLPIAGYATIAIYDVEGATGKTDINKISTEKQAHLRVLCDQESDHAGGGAWGGTKVRPTLAH
jgi:hypothetical protein